MEAEVYTPWPGVMLLLGLAPLALVMFMVMLYIPLKVVGVSLKEALKYVTLPEGVLFGLYAIACADIVGSVFSRFV